MFPHQDRPEVGVSLWNSVFDRATLHLHFTIGGDQYGRAKE